uniref:Uncharacterized protein n=1 Tax=Nelumbo nucifera TaxID=4432 RepID=A0A822XSW4_NELNU|nr:TPA_asm: hypothetical protein HUJ06_023697 [Nelumbo nucifera]DAD22236.1 TPA_asm: hypothetical protein HUJ06_023699 [Nelumbo nucifera]DAD22245.1 TPA_asm: hypothetical protein HUJ06_023708 [Nelumbo nucifera]DAD22251.1 TPA_asm: hypothetical protein HUJ06_023714 [Nelumbo nucifera]DAD22261.1 TPA_asm: hypothetical protein HUJ06_023724 [Nelumbo nucifera]
MVMYPISWPWIFVLLDQVPTSHDKYPMQRLTRHVYPFCSGRSHRYNRLEKENGRQRWREVEHCDRSDREQWRYRI